MLRLKTLFLRGELCLDKSNIRIVWEEKDCKLSHKHSAFLGKVYFEIDSAFYPKKRAEGFPAMIMRWYLKELRLLNGKSNVVCRQVFFYPDPSNDILIKRYDEKYITLTFRERNKIIIECQSEWIQTFEQVLNEACNFYNKFRNLPEYGGDILVLGEEINMSSKLLKRIKKER